MTRRTLQEEAKAVLAVWDDPDMEGEDLAAAMERLRVAVDPLEADIIQTVEVDPAHRYLLCVWLRHNTLSQVGLDNIRAGMMVLAKQIEQGGRIVQAGLGPDVERIELVGFEVASADAEVAAADAAVAVAEAGASRAMVAG